MAPVRVVNLPTASGKPHRPAAGRKKTGGKELTTFYHQKATNRDFYGIMKRMVFYAKRRGEDKPPGRDFYAGS